MTPADVRQSLVHALGLDLVGPDKGSPLANELLPQSPSRWYLTGFLIPAETDFDQQADPAASETIDLFSESGGDDNQAPEPASARRARFPSSMGMSLLVPPEVTRLQVIVRWGDYKPVYLPVEGEKKGDPTLRRPDQWQRVDRAEGGPFNLRKSNGIRENPVPNSDGLFVVVSARPVHVGESFAGLVPQGTRSVSVFLVNRRTQAPDEVRDSAFVFQAALEVKSDVPFVARPNLRGLGTEDWDERVADLQYRDAFEFAVGHNVATRAVVDDLGECREVHTRWLPAAEVERVAPAVVAGVELSMEALATLADGAQANEKLSALPARYREWIARQESALPADPPARRLTAEKLIQRARVAAGRIEDGIALLSEDKVLDAFRIANKVMAASGRRREARSKGKQPAEVAVPTWRPFQLAFLLMNLRGIADPVHADREVVDLLFFPTGGGKTEAYLGLAAFTLVLRRLRQPGLKAAGLSVLMRYTLRLLTLDQLGRAAALVCALELERQQDVDKLGGWPFEIGLWVGRAATPNEMGRKNDGNSNSARARTIAYQHNSSGKPSPIPLEECPWCGTRFTKDSFCLVPNADAPTDLRITCVNRRCDFTQGKPLPILAVDEPIYRRLPCFLIATVDKFAAMPWTGPVGGFFGRVDRYDNRGFYGPCHLGCGTLLPVPLLPPDLVIQDELHLISGPMGTMVGLYETALDELCSRKMGEKTVRPKVVASTATVRRAEQQIRALFNRTAVDIFPPPGHDRRDSFFARTHRTNESNARLYLGVAAQGRSLKVVLLRVYLALLGTAQKAWLAAGGEKKANNPADAYMTLLGYFNALRELGGSRRIVEDEVTTRLPGYGDRRRVNEADGLFASRQISYDVVELTSRVRTDQVASAKSRLALLFHEKEHVDVAIATNMISVGLDIIRLGLMVVLGQPKTSAEYIQATSRVGRDPERPGLVVALLNVHRPRDRSHYERFSAYHQSFYRSVEATSVTPFSPRALDRGLVGTLVALARLGHAPMTAARGATEILRERARLDFAVNALACRAASQGSLSGPAAEELRERVRQRASRLLDEWELIANEQVKVGGLLQYQQEVGAAQRLLYEFLHPDLRNLVPPRNHFRANRSMRDVEPSVNLWVRTLDNIEVPEGEE